MQTALETALETTTTPFRCPVCHAALAHIANSRSYACSNRHSFDQAKEGYLNLLLVTRKHSAEPGDNKAQLQSRRSFLQQGFYAPLAAALVAHIRLHCPDPDAALTLLDAGCGEGYYLQQIALQLAQQLNGHVRNIQFIGTDISRDAVRMSAKQHPTMRFAVASSFDLPLPDQSVDVLVRVFAPASDTEIARVLKPGGLYLWAHPGAQHLYELRALIYDAPQLHDTTLELPADLELVEHQAVGYPLHLPDPAAVSALLAMTPYYWAASREKQAYCQQLPQLNVTVDFCLTVMRKS